MTSMTGAVDKFKAVFFGPGWFPGTERLGNLDELPDVRLQHCRTMNEDENLIYHLMEICRPREERSFPNRYRRGCKSTQGSISSSCRKRTATLQAIMT